MIKKKCIKRRKDKYNPYNIFEIDEAKYISFFDGKHCYQEFEINKDLYDIFNEFELSDLSYLNVWDRHIEHSEIWENSLDKRTIVEFKSVEEIVIEKLQNEKLYSAISKLSDIQRRRVILHFFEGMTYTQIAVHEQCSKVAVKYTIDKALRQLKMAI